MTKFDVFDLSSLNTKVGDELPQSLIEKASSIVRKRMTELTGGTPEEIAIHNELLAKCTLGDKAAQAYVKSMIKKIIELDYKLATPPLSDKLAKKVYEDNYGLGAIDDLFHDPTINEISVNGAEHIWIERGGLKYRLDRRFKNDEDVMRVIRLLLQFDKKDITVQEPMRESRMADGSRLTLMIPPVAKRPYIMIRKFEAFDLTTENLVNAGTVNEEMVEWLKKVVRGRANILVIGETGSGKTSLLKWLIGLTDDRLRIGTIETNFELKLDEKYPDRNIFCYEEQENLGITMSDLFRKTLRSTPDIIIVGEARGEEAEQMINAMRRGHPGSMSTIHTNSAETAIDDLAEMINMDGRRRDPIQLRHRVASAIDLIIQIHRFDETGIRRVTRITEVVTDTANYDYRLEDIFRYELDPENPREGEFKRVGKLSEQLKRKLNHFGLTQSQLRDV